MYRFRILVPLLALLLIVPAVPQSDVKKSFNFFLGGKKIDDLSEDNTGGELDKQFALGVEMSFGGYDWPVMFALDILASRADDNFTYRYDYYYYPYGYYYIDFEAEVEASTFEVDFGIRKTWEFVSSPVRPYIGVGVAVIRGEAELNLVDEFIGSQTFQDDDIGFGGWVGGGVYWKLGDKFNLGFNVRYSTAKVDFDDLGTNNLDIGGTSAGLILGWGF
ncbi:MAG: outer membrane beta-barrel protein [Candidatus Polarisedimenticolia bacterium]